MRYDGTLRCKGHNNLGPTDEAWHSILRGEYYKNKLGYEIVCISERPDLIEKASRWFHEKWGVPLEAYVESMEASLGSRTYPEWYAAILNGRIIAGLGVIENDFHNRKDLAPNVCAVYTEPEFRNMGIAGVLLDGVCEHMRKRGVSPLYLLTDHDSFYERYGWEFLTMAQGDGEPDLSRLYVHL
ncbi:MAG: GNAT family N-acetyltransferase [Clostridiales bacterium]|nr:GNAT family N-acetyltransferase [Clostridiales bacterium]